MTETDWDANRGSYWESGENKEEDIVVITVKRIKHLMLPGH